MHFHMAKKPKFCNLWENPFRGCVRSFVYFIEVFFSYPWVIEAADYLTHNCYRCSEVGQVDDVECIVLKRKVSGSSISVLLEQSNPLM